MKPKQPWAGGEERARNIMKNLSKVAGEKFPHLDFPMTPGIQPVESGIAADATAEIDKYMGTHAVAPGAVSTTPPHTSPTVREENEGDRKTERDLFTDDENDPDPDSKKQKLFEPGLPPKREQNPDLQSAHTPPDFAK